MSLISSLGFIFGFGVGRRYTQMIVRRLVESRVIWRMKTAGSKTKKEIYTLETHNIMPQGNPVAFVSLHFSQVCGY
jgi:hypothetical protein